MNFEPDAQEEAFRSEIRAFLTEQMLRQYPNGPPPPGSMELHAPASVRPWTRVLDSKDLLVPHWSPEWGGASWPLSWHHILHAELARASCPPTDTIGVNFVGPLLCRFGSAEQKRRFLPRIRNADDLWCQGFSEPNAGSDTMAIQTTAKRRGDELYVSGQKVWITNAHNADMMFALVRVEATNKRQHGLTLLLLSTRSPGITIRPIETIDGSHHLNEVFFDSVRVPATNVVGEEGRGWVYARSLLEHERTTIAGLGIVRALLDGLKHSLAASARSREPRYLDFVARAEAELQALEFMELRLLYSRDSEGNQLLPPILKLGGSELRQRVTEISLEVAGEAALKDPCGPSGEDAGNERREADFATFSYLFQRSATIAGGTSEIQRNIIAAMGLGL